jgi:hypothetical protein
VAADPTVTVAVAVAVLVEFFAVRVYVVVCWGETDADAEA